MAQPPPGAAPTARQTPMHRRLSPGTGRTETGGGDSGEPARLDLQQRAAPARHHRRRLAGYALAALLPVLVTLVVRSLGPDFASAALGLYVLAILGAALVGGTGPGLVATGIAVIAAGVWALPPFGAPRLESLNDAIRLALVGIVGASASVFIGTLRGARERARRATAEAEQLSAQLRARMSELQRETAQSWVRAERLQRTTGEYELVTRALSGARDAADAERRRVARLLESIRDGFFTLDAEHRVTYANDALLKMWRRTRDEVLGRNIWDLVPDAVGSAFHENTLRTQRDQVVTEFEEYYEPLRTNFAVKTVPFDDGVSVVLRDISARVRAEREVRASEARYRALADASTKKVWSTSANGSIGAMPFWSDLTGRLLEGDEWDEVVHPEDRQRVGDSWARAREAGEPFQCEFRVHRADGKYRWYHSRAIPVRDERGRIQEWVGVLDDVDAEHRAEEGRHFLERASEALVASLDVRSTLATVVRLAIDGSTPFADTARADVPATSGGFECLAFESRDAALAEAYQALEAAHPVPIDSPIGFPHVIATGQADLLEDFESTHAPIIASIAPEHAEALRRAGAYSGLCVPLRARGETLGALTLVLHGPERRRPYDRSDLALAEELGRRAGLALDNALRFEATESARREAEHANRAKADFLAVMSHELRTPLNAIAGYAELLLLEVRGTLTDEQRDDLERIQRSQHHLLALVNDVLNFAKLDAGRVEFDIEDVLVADVLDGLDALVAPQMERKQLTYDIAQCAEDLFVRADIEKLRQVLLNLLSNAVKATDSGGRITVHCRAARDRVQITVADTGRGVPSDKLEKIFHPFVQIGRRLSSGHEGTGLGLAISRELARAMDGDITVESEVGVGSRFTVTLPRAVT